MAWLGILGLAVGLGADAMSVAAAVGVRWHGPRQRFRLAWHMGLLQFLMPLAGYAAGQQVAGLVAAWGAWIAAALVFGIGAKMLLEALRSHPGIVAERTAEWEEDHFHRDPTRGWSLMVLSVATSLDALLVGVSLGLEGGKGIWAASVLIGLVAAGMVLAGIALGKRLGRRIGRPAEIAGGVVLMALAVTFVAL